MDCGPTDLACMLLVEFALAYGNDWFVIPIEVDVGSLHRTRSLVVTDTFGVRTLIKPSSELGAPHSRWRMFHHSFLRGSGLHYARVESIFPATITGQGTREPAH